MFNIEKGVPMPPSRKTKMEYPFSQMQVGESFLIPSEGAEARLARSRVESAARTAGRRLGAKFTVRITPEGVRVWRVEPSAE